MPDDREVETRRISGEAAGDSATDAPLPLAEISHYRLLARVGSGGMGEVYRARDLRLDRDVALKFLPSDLAADAGRRRRLEREARLLAAMNHPNILTIHDFENIDGVCFLVTELVRGATLAKRLPAAGWPPAQWLALAVPLIDAVAAAHAEGIVHRDLKLSNVMLGPQDHLKVLDFGLAKVVAPRAAGLELTRAGSLLGTTPYLSPERVRGEEATPASDVFALGVMLYEMATGKRPFRGPSAAEVMGSILRDEPRWSRPAISRLPAGIETILRRCLEKAPEGRYATAGELRGALRDLPERAPAFPHRTGTDPRPRVGVFPFENLGDPDDTYLAAGVAEEIRSRLCAVPELAIVSRSSTTRYDRADKSIAQIGADLSVDFVLEGSLRWDSSARGAGRIHVVPDLVRVADDTSVWSATYERGLQEVFDVQAEIAHQVVLQMGLTLGIPAGMVGEQGLTANMDAYRAYLKGRALRGSVSKREVHSAIRRFEDAVELDPEFTAAWAALSRTHARLAFILQQTDGEHVERAREALDRALTLASDSVAVRLALGYYHYHGRQDYEQALNVFQRMPPNAERDAVDEALSYLQSRRGEWDEAESRAQSVIRQDPRHAGRISWAATLLSFRRRYLEADRLYDRAISLEPELSHLYAWRAVNRLKWNGDASAALREIDRAPDPAHPDLAYYRYSIRLCQRRLDATLDELETAAPVVRDDQNHFLPKELLVAYAQHLLGSPEAVPGSAGTVRELLESKCGEAPDDPRYHSSLGLAYALLGEADAARAHVGLAVRLCPVSHDARTGPTYRVRQARVQAITGDPDGALHNLAELLRFPSNLSAALLRCEPVWDPLRKHARFEELAADMP